MREIRRWELIDPPRNRYRWYELARPNECVVVRRWGRIGRRGRCKVDVCPSRVHADRLVRCLVRRRERHGYRPVHAFWEQLSLWPGV